MDRVEKAAELVRKAERRGVRLNFDCDFLTARITHSGDPGEQELITAELMKYLAEVRRIVKERTSGARARDFLGHRILVSDGLNLQSGGEGVLSGVLADASGNGGLSISLPADENWNHARTITANVEKLLIVMDEEADAGSSVQNDESKSEQRPKGLIERVRDSLR